MMFKQTPIPIPTSVNNLTKLLITPINPDNDDDEIRKLDSTNVNGLMFADKLLLF